MSEECEHDFSIGQDWQGNDDYGAWETVITCDKCGFDLCDLPLNTRLKIQITHQPDNERRI